MKIFLGIFVVLLIIAAAGIYYFYPTLYGLKPDNFETPRLKDLSSLNTSSAEKDVQLLTDIPAETIIAENLNTPWAIAFLPSGDMLVTERKGTVRFVEKSGNLLQEPVVTLGKVKEIGEGGLLGIALDPTFTSNNFVYLYYTYSGDGNNTLNRIVKMKYQDNKLTNEKILIDNIPGSSNHNGGRIKFGSDNYLYVTTGDAENPSHAQDINSLAGKILRVTDEGQPAPGNPFTEKAGPFTNLQDPKFAIFTIGHRNPQGITWDKDGNLWETEHGPSGGSLGTGNDEINIIEYGNNYGWPEIQGDQTKESMVIPVKNSTPQVAWAPGDIAIIGDTLYFTGLRGQAIYRAKINNNKLTLFQELLKGKYGRLREIIVGPDGMLYLTTSNRDGRGVPKPEDDRIIRINPNKL